jgi:hypothetical protein
MVSVTNASNLHYVKHVVQIYCIIKTMTLGFKSSYERPQH